MQNRDRAKNNITHVSFVMTEACNLRCEYCFFEKHPKSTNWKTGKRLVDWLSENNPKDETVFIQFFGGEPTLMWPLIVDMVEYARGTKTQNFRFGITSNGLLLDADKRRWLRQKDIDVLFSTDGCQEAQDTHRKMPDGSGSFEHMIDNMRACVEDGISTVGRLTYTPKTLSMLYDSIVFLQDEIGFPVVAPTAAIDGFADFTGDDLLEWDKQYAKIQKRFADKVLAGVNPGMNYLDKCIRQITKGEKMQAPCGAGGKFAGISYDGGIYPCHRFVQWPEWRFGDVFKGLYPDAEKTRGAAAGFHLDSASPKCAKCNVLFCGGHCLAANYSQNGSIWIPNTNGCKVIPKQFEVATRLYNELGHTPQFQQIFGKHQPKPQTEPQKKAQESLESRMANIEKMIVPMAKMMLDEGGIASAKVDGNSRRNNIAKSKRSGVPTL